MEELFSKQAVSVYAEVWKLMSQGEALSGDRALIAHAMKDHPEFNPFWPQGELAFHPQEIEGYVVNPLVHTGIHVAVEKQLSSLDPEEATLALQALLKRGISHHEAVHRIGGLWGELYFKSVREGAAPDEWTYVEELKAMIVQAEKEISASE
ncbi:MAG: DUF1841 family protein [Nitrospiria bacterium]